MIRFFEHFIFAMLEGQDDEENIVRTIASVKTSKNDVGGEHAG